MEFKPYQHVERLGTDEVENLLDGEVHIFPKLDGSCSSIWLDNGVLKVGSRKRVITIEDDNQGCCKWVTENAEPYLNFLKDHPNIILYGEWLVGVHIKSYVKDMMKRVYIFDMYDTETDTYVPYLTYMKWCEGYKMLYIPCIGVGKFTYEEIKGLAENNHFLLPEDRMAEGVVVKRYDY